MFEVFATVCYMAAFGLNQCDDFVIESYTDQLSCEIVAADLSRRPEYINPACIPSPAVEPMP